MILGWQQPGTVGQCGGFSIAGVAQLVEHYLAKVDVASSNLVSRSTPHPPSTQGGCLLTYLCSPLWPGHRVCSALEQFPHGAPRRRPLLFRADLGAGSGLRRRRRGPCLQARGLLLRIVSLRIVQLDFIPFQDGFAVVAADSAGSHDSDDAGHPGSELLQDIPPGMGWDRGAESGT